MASTNTATATASSDAGEGPVMALINKRLRALRKKLNRITEMEESVSKGKPLNNDEQKLLCSKPSVLILIEEYEKLHAPLSAAVPEEITLATTHPHHHHNQALPDQNEVADVPEEKEATNLEDLVNLLYFGSLFDVKPQNELASIMLTRTHERRCGLGYDTVTDESTDLLCDKDLDLISELWTMMISRPADSSLSHKNALERCIEHAKLWLANSDQPIASNCNVSYAGLREKLKKIMGSNYFTITPKMVAPVEAAGADHEQKEEDASTSKELESAVNDQSEQPTRQDISLETMPQRKSAPPLTSTDKGKGKLADSSIDVIALWDKENAPLCAGYHLNDLRVNINDSLKKHDDRLVLGRLIAYGPNLRRRIQNGIEYVPIPRVNIPCQSRVSKQCLKLVVKNNSSNRVKVMRCTDIADKYIITEVCHQMLLDETKHVLIMAGDADFRTCIEGFKKAYFMLAQPKSSSKKLRLTTKATWSLGTEDDHEHDMLYGRPPRYETAPGYKSCRQ